MAVGEGSDEPDSLQTPKSKARPATQSSGRQEHEQADDDGEDEEEEEPRLKYASITKHLSSLYRNGDASSAVLVAGDKMHVLSLPTFTSLRVYHAHSASISAVSISPFPPPLPTGQPERVNRLASESRNKLERSPTTSSVSLGARSSPGQPVLPNTPSNSIYIATCSIDGNVCISSLVDVKDVQLRNFRRPIQSVALSPNYKYDRTYLSGGQAGSLIITKGGQAGKSANATTTSAAAAASGWLGAIGLAADAGTDKVLHSGEGIISVIRWSLSGKYVLWVNEHGIWFMRTHLYLESGNSGFEWRRIGHVDRPSRPGWEEMASVWKARADWIDRDNLEPESDSPLGMTNAEHTNGGDPRSLRPIGDRERVEEAVVGWGDTVWLIKVYPTDVGTGNEAVERKIGRTEVATILRTDCTISGVSLYTPNLLLVLAHMESEDGKSSKKTLDTTKRKGRQHRHNSLEPELRLIDINAKEEISRDTLSVSRFQSLSASDYHLGVLPPSNMPAVISQRGALGALGSGMYAVGSGIGAVGYGIGSGLETVGHGVWDATLYPTRIFSSNRIVSSSESGQSGKSSDDKSSGAKASGFLSNWIPTLSSQQKELSDVATTEGMKIFIYSPYDCILAMKRDIADRLQWLVKMERYQQAWELLDEHPEAIRSSSEPSVASPPPTPSRANTTASGTPGPRPAPNTLADFFADSSSLSVSSKTKNINSAGEKEKRRIGELWLQQLIATKDWSKAGEVAGKVLNTSSRWEHWIWVFVKEEKFDEITPVVPIYQISPPLPSSIYEIILAHYLSVDRLRFKELVDLWPADIFDVSSIITAIGDQLRSATAPKHSTDWRLLQESLAKLYVADGRHADALRCYIRLQDADTALSMIKEYHLLEAVADDVPGLVLLRISPEQLRTATNSELEDLSSDPTRLLVEEASHGVLQPETVVTQLEESSHLLFLFFYLRALWRGEGLSSPAGDYPRRVGRSAAATNLAADEGKSLVNRFADRAVELFADFDRDVLMDFLQTSTAYTFNKAVQVCERRHYIPESVYLLSKTGQTKKALSLIIDELQDVSQAINFAKQQDDHDLWDDLLEYSMSRPRFISGLLSEVGTSINPLALVKRIPSGLEIEGLRDGLKKMIREYDLQDSISMGVARVLQSEVAVAMETLRRGRNRGIRFDVTAGGTRGNKSGGEEEGRSEDATADEKEKKKKKSEPARLSKQASSPGHCMGCGEAFLHGEPETLVGFACGHVYHISHLLHDDQTSPSTPAEQDIDADGGYGSRDTNPTFVTRTVGAKVTTARLLMDRIDAVGGCRTCKVQKDKVAEV